MKITETWAVDLCRIETFFLSQNGVPVTDTGTGEPGPVTVTGKTKSFHCGSCAVRLTPLSPHPVGPVKVPRTLVEITGEEEAAKALYGRFFLRFISAGG